MKVVTGSENSVALGDGIEKFPSQSEDNDKIETRSAASLNEVAHRAGVSPTTASLFFNGRESVCSKATAARLRQAAAELHYEVNRARRQGRETQTTSDVAQSPMKASPVATPPISAPKPAPGVPFLPHKRTYVLGVCIPHDGVSPPSASAEPNPRTDVFLEQLWRGICHVADVEDFLILQYPRRIRESESIDLLLSATYVNGILMLARGDDPRPRLLAEAGIPVVLVGRLSEVPEGCGAVFALESDTVDLALSHLWQLGHRRIAYVTPADTQTRNPQHETVKWRLERYAAWMQIRRAYASELVFTCDDGADCQEEAANVIREMMTLPDLPTAILCANDLVAACVCTALQEVGKNVPRDISVVGIDNSVYATDSTPTVTSVEIPYEEVGVQAVVQLTRLLEGASAATCRVAIAVSNLVVRESTGPAPSPSVHP